MRHCLICDAHCRQSRQVRSDLAPAVLVWNLHSSSARLLLLWLMYGLLAWGRLLQSVGITQGYYLFNAAPYVLTLALMICTSAPQQRLAGAPGELGVSDG